MKSLAVAGTAAMFLVGGGILTHGVRAVGEWIEHAAVDAARIPGAGAVLGALTPTLANAARRHRRRRARRAGASSCSSAAGTGPDAVPANP